MMPNIWRKNFIYLPLGLCQPEAKFWAAGMIEYFLATRYGPPNTPRSIHNQVRRATKVAARSEYTRAWLRAPSTTCNLLFEITGVGKAPIRVPLQSLLVGFGNRPLLRWLFFIHTILVTAYDTLWIGTVPQSVPIPPSIIFWLPIFHPNLPLTALRHPIC